MRSWLVLQCAVMWAMSKPSPIESIYGARLIWGGRCSGLRPAKDTFLIMPFGFIMERMVTSPRCFDVGFVSGISLDMLSTHLLQC